ncbi:MAG: ATP-binding cassette domain-containing protein, partial [Muribaculaceae bacterium]|nr:ATP-binding cassette domain-containing protein [Muribaculaceae bacterium]
PPSLRAQRQIGRRVREKRVKVLSGGEKTRLAMIKLLLEPVNFLILDEPTNHLDIRSKDILKDAIKEFDGTVIVVSHDREFLDGLVEKVYEFGGGEVRENIGGIYEFLERKRIASLSDLEKQSFGSRGKAEASAVQSQQGDTDKKVEPLSYAQQKERDRTIRKAEKVLKEAENKVADLEEQIAAFEKKLECGDSSPEVLEAYSKISSQLEDAMEEWEEAQEKYDNIKNADDFGNN